MSSFARASGSSAIGGRGSGAGPALGRSDSVAAASTAGASASASASSSAICVVGKTWDFHVKTALEIKNDLVDYSLPEHMLTDLGNPNIGNVDAIHLEVVLLSARSLCIS